ncbi:MAG: DUF192 domain-containing protein [Minisyncoccia bacterium]
MKKFKNKKIKNKFLSGIIAFVCIVGIGFIIYSKKEPEVFVYDNAPLQQKRILIGGTTYTVSVADTEARREQGLSGTKPLLPHTGMLFVFDVPAKYGFWMKDMNYAIDIIWVNTNTNGIGTVVYIEQNVKPESYPKTFSNVNIANAVIEVTAGEVSKNNIKIGDRVYMGKK